VPLPLVLALIGLLLLAALALGALALRTLVRRERTRADAAIAAASETLARADRLASTGRLAAGIAHEVGNPLAAIAGYSHVVRLRAGGTDGVDTALDALDREVERIERIVGSLLDFARPRRATPGAVRVDALLNDVVRLVRDQGLLRRVEVTWDVEQREAAIRAERHDLEQAFVNLLLNAVDAMHGAGRLMLRSRVVSAESLLASTSRRHDDPAEERFEHAPSAGARAWLQRSERPASVLQVVVADSGPGVPDDDADRIFEPFYSTKPAGRGTGLGLAIVAQTVEGLGGTIWVQRAREGGAAFVLLLPLLGATEVQAAAK
jgi:signal transduction histidine kinase